MSSTVDTAFARRAQRQIVGPPVVQSPKFCAFVLRQLAASLETYDPRAEPGSLAPAGRVLAVAGFLLDGKGADSDLKDVDFLQSVGVPQASLPRPTGSRPLPSRRKAPANVPAMEAIAAAIGGTNE